MGQDPIVEEVRMAREAYAAAFDFDLEAMAEDLRDKEQKGERKVVRRVPREPVVKRTSAA